MKLRETSESRKVKSNRIGIASPLESRQPHTRDLPSRQTGQTIIVEESSHDLSQNISCINPCRSFGA